MLAPEAAELVTVVPKLPVPPAMMVAFDMAVRAMAESSETAMPSGCHNPETREAFTTAPVVALYSPILPPP